MSEVINTTQYLDLVGLKKYDGLIKLFIEKGDKDLADQIASLAAKIGNLDIEGSDDKTLVEIVDGIYESIKALGEKDIELDGKISEEIGKIVGDLDSLEEGVNQMTLVQIANKIKAIDDSITNLKDVYAPKAEFDEVKKKIDDITSTGGEPNVQADWNTTDDTADSYIKNKPDLTVFATTKAVQDAQAAAEATASADATSKANAAQAAAEATAAADATSKANAAQAAAEATASADATSKANAAESAAKTYADGLVKDEEGKVKFDAVGSAAAAQSAAEATASADATSKANAAQAAAISAAAADATSKADTARETAIETASADATAKADAAQAAAIEAAATDAQAKADAAQAAAYTSAKEYVDAISHAVNVDYDVNTQRVYLYDANGSKIGNGFDATPFIVDGMLENVSFVYDGSDSDSDSDAFNTTLRFTFNTESGKKEIDVDFSEYVDVYHADNSSIALDPATNTFSVINVDATKTKTVDKIPVAGGPLAKLFEKAGIDVSDIAAGSSVEEILKSLLCKELWPESIKTDEASLTSSVDVPTVTLNGKTSGTSDVEVGTSVTYSVSSGKSSYTATPHTASNLVYGYSAADDNTVDNTNTTKKASFGTINPVSTSVPKLTLSGLVSKTVNGTAGSADKGAVSTSGNVVIEEGEKTLSAYGTSITFTGTCSKLDKVYGCSNLGKTNNKGTVYTSTEKLETIKTSTAVNSGTISVKCVGKYKYFVGYSNKTDYKQFDSGSVRALTAKSGYLTVDGTTNVIKGDEDTLTSNGTSIVIACPKKYALTNIQNGVGASILSNFSSVGEVEVDTGTTKTYYNVYVYPITNGATVTFKNVTITKA